MLCHTGTRRKPNCGEESLRSGMPGRRAFCNSAKVSKASIFRERIMKKRFLISLTILALFGTGLRCQDTVPLKLVQTFKLSPQVKGNFDHFGIDLKGGRLFATPEGYHAVVVFDLKTGKLVHKIDGIGKPHAVLYREDLNRIYVTDGDAGDLKIFDGTTYSLVSSVKLLEDADSIGYDPATKYLYIDNGGGDVHQTFSMLSVIDTTAGEKLADLKIDGETLEAMALEKSTSKMYVNNRSKNQVSVVDRQKRELVASWPVTLARTTSPWPSMKRTIACSLPAALGRSPCSIRKPARKLGHSRSPKALTTLPTMRPTNASTPLATAPLISISSPAPIATSWLGTSPQALWEGQRVSCPN